MSRDFYSELLGLPPGARPPDHFALLGLPPLCRDLKRIEKSARHRLDQLDRFHSSRDAEKREACLVLMDEIAEARSILLDLHEFNGYVKSLRLLHSPDAIERKGTQVATPDSDVIEILQFDAPADSDQKVLPPQRPKESEAFATRLRQTRVRFGVIDELAEAVSGISISKENTRKRDVSPHGDIPYTGTNRSSTTLRKFNFNRIAKVLLGVTLLATVAIILTFSMATWINGSVGLRDSDQRDKRIFATPTEKYNRAGELFKSGRIDEAIAEYESFLTRADLRIPHSSTMQELKREAQQSLDDARRALDLHGSLLSAIQMGQRAGDDIAPSDYLTLCQHLSQTVMDAKPYVSRVSSFGSAVHKAEAILVTLEKQWDSCIRRMCSQYLTDADDSLATDDLHNAIDAVQAASTVFKERRNGPQFESIEREIVEVTQRLEANWHAISDETFRHLTDTSLKANMMAADTLTIDLTHSRREFFDMRAVFTDKVVYLIDVEGVSPEQLRVLLKEINILIGDLSPGDWFTVILFGDNFSLSYGPKWATISAKRNWINRCKSLSLARPAEEAVDRLHTVKSAIGLKPKVVFMASVRILGHRAEQVDRSELMRMLNVLNRNRKITINTIQLIYPDSQNTLRDIAKEHGGWYRFVREKDLGLDR